MRCFSLLLGARNTPAATARFSAKDEACIRMITFRHFPQGFTILNADGGWFDPSKKTFVEEQSRQILICTSEPRKLAAWCEELASALKQDELLVVELGRAATFTARTGRKRKSSRAQRPDHRKDA
ncbi:MAG TPA: DUF3574 domain-containing protein [Opitutus sp.]|nr:DUF3574 domain-containing protein [Opitutus sp.]